LLLLGLKAVDVINSLEELINRPTNQPCGTNHLFKKLIVVQLIKNLAILNDSKGSPPR
jgi:hypothetical protein